MFLIKYDRNPNIVKVYKTKMKEYLQKAEINKKKLTGENKPEVKNDDIKGHQNDVNKQEKLSNMNYNIIVRSKPNIKFSDILGLNEVKEVVKEHVILPIKFPQLF